MSESKTILNASSAELDRSPGYPVPLHEQLRRVLQSRIDRGEWKVGQVIPRELDLMEQYGLSRYTVRQALDELAQAGQLTRTKKRGTVVSQPKVEQNLSRFYSFMHDMEAKGLKTVSFVLALEEISPDEETARVLGLADEDTTVYHLKRLRVVNDEPLAIESSYLNLRLSQGVDLYRYDWRQLALYDVLEKDFEIRVGRAEEFLEPVYLELAEAQLLGLAGRDPVPPAFRVERLTYNEAGRVFERRISLVRGDRYRFRAELPQVSRHD